MGLRTRTSIARARVDYCGAAARREAAHRREHTEQCSGSIHAAPGIYGKNSYLPNVTCASERRAGDEGAITKALTTCRPRSLGHAPLLHSTRNRCTRPASECPPHPTLTRDADIVEPHVAVALPSTDSHTPYLARPILVNMLFRSYSITRLHEIPISVLAILRIIC